MWVFVGWKGKGGGRKGGEGRENWGMGVMGGVWVWIWGRLHSEDRRGWQGRGGERKVPCPGSAVSPGFT